jgi:uncharacterized membrane protein YgdD (TMEM256/DUF423 family)
MTEQALTIGPAVWRRALWMRIAALTGLMSVLIWFAANAPGVDSDMASKLRLGAQVQFMHGMVVFSCATFMNIGARDARHAPPFLFAGMLLYSVPLYVAAWLGVQPNALAQDLGIIALAIGWLILAWSAREIDLASTD